SPPSRPKVKGANSTGRRRFSMPEGEEKTEAPPFPAELKEGRALVTDSARYGELEESGYGAREGKELWLQDYEALYLLYAKKLELASKGGEQVGFEGLAEETQRKVRDSWTKFIIYRDLRSRGYVVREGFGFGTDLRVYERGDYPKKPAKYVVFALDEGIERRVDDLQKSVREMAKMGKEAIIAVIERRGEVIYYRVSRARF
ncbi:MAG: tRNA-intron lyase, partial [Nitrososphaerales archaeon]|nr:tRNA-intron lyase [Nitrososphaerales archaeon]